MLVKPDELVLSVMTFSSDVVMPSDDGVPMESHTTASLVGGKKEDVANCRFIKEIPLEIRIYSSGELVAEDTLKIVTDTIDNMILKSEVREGDRVISVEDLSPVQQELLKGIVLAPRQLDWVASDTAWGPVEISFEDSSLGPARYQVFAVDNMAKKIIVDSDGDGRRDFEVIRPTSAQGQEIRKYDKASTPMNPWTPTMFESSTGWMPCGGLQTSADSSPTGPAGPSRA
jgi:hypothetical protein